MNLLPSMVLIPGGVFNGAAMEPFSLGRTPVTNAEYSAHLDRYQATPYVYLGRDGTVARGIDVRCSDIGFRVAAPFVAGAIALLSPQIAQAQDADPQDGLNRLDIVLIGLALTCLVLTVTFVRAYSALKETERQTNRLKKSRKELGDSRDRIRTLHKIVSETAKEGAVELKSKKNGKPGPKK
jgi:hypothetical protein